MKHFKIICLIFLFLLSFLRSTEYYKYQPKLNDYCHQENFTTDELPPLFSSDVSMSKNLEIHFIVKKKIKYRATTSDSNILKTLYFSKLLNFKILEDSLIYGIATIYQIQRHTHLHLYQLF